MVKNLLDRRDVMSKSERRILFWIEPSTVQTILDTFGGTDGQEVIRATNDYLNGLTFFKASALAGYINEDPMMVCSLGLSVSGVTMPIRLIVGDGAGYFDTLIKPTTTMRVQTEFLFNATQAVNDPIFFGARDGSSGLIVGKGNLAETHLYVNNTSSTGVVPCTLMAGDYVSIDMQSTRFTCNGTDYTCVAPIAVNWSMILCGRKYGVYQVERVGALSYRFFKTIDDNITRHYVPYRKKNGDSYTCEMLDVENIVLAERHGYFTIPDVNYYHISSSSEQAIIDAFGQDDGKKVISATNTYLNTIDSTKAHSLVEFINEDPMMVCSLGLEPRGVVMPVRYFIDTNETCWFDSEIKTLASTKVYSKIYTSQALKLFPFGCRLNGVDNSRSFYIGYYNLWSDKLRVFNGSSNPYPQFVLTSGLHEISLEPNKGVIDGVTYNTSTNIGSTTNLILMGMDWGGDTADFTSIGSANGAAYYHIEGASDGRVHTYVPFVSNVQGQCLLDLEDLSLLKKIGSGVYDDELILPDGTPWTPLNQRT